MKYGSLFIAGAILIIGIAFLITYQNNQSQKQQIASQNQAALSQCLQDAQTQYVTDIKDNTDATTGLVNNVNLNELDAELNSYRNTCISEYK